MSGAGPSAMNDNAAGDGSGSGDRGANANGEPLDRLASDGSKYFKTQQQKEALEEAYKSAFRVEVEGGSEREREREREKEEVSTPIASIETLADDKKKNSNKKKKLEQKNKTPPPQSASASPPTWASRPPTMAGSSA